MRKDICNGLLLTTDLGSVFIRSQQTTKIRRNLNIFLHVKSKSYFLVFAQNISISTQIKQPLFSELNEFVSTNLALVCHDRVMFLD